MEGSELRKVKHIGVRHHYIRELVGDGLVEVKQVPSGEQVADVLTKAVSVKAFESCVRVMMGEK
jgi:hypothetical protein